jgi:hypothetical protein
LIAIAAMPERGLGDRATQEPRLLLGLRLPAPSENRAEQAGLLVYLAGQLRQALRVLEILDATLVEATEAQLALAPFPLEQLSELDPLLRGSCVRTHPKRPADTPGQTPAPRRSRSA